MSHFWHIINGRYLPLRPISGGGSATVYLALDRARDDSAVALKLFELDDDASRAAARHEFGVLRRLSHPCITRVHDLQQIEHVEPTERPRTPPSLAAGTVAAFSVPPPPPPIGSHIVAADYVSGLDLEEAFRALFPELAVRLTGGGSAAVVAPDDPRWSTFYRALGDVASGLDAIHAHGLVHRDVKPQNMLLTPRSDDEGEGALAGDTGEIDFQVKLIDLGFAEWESNPAGQSVRGTVPYLAPELVDGGTVDRRGDLYALGQSILRATTGRHWLPCEPLEDWLRFVRERRSIPVRSAMRQMPPALTRIVSDLLEFEPRHRPASAAELRERLLSIGNGASRSASNAPARALPSLGWTHQVQAVREQLDSLRRLEPTRSMLLLETPSGSHVEPLLEEIETAATLAGVAFACGTAQRPSRRPFQAVAEALADLASTVDFRAPTFRRFVSALAPVLPARTVAGAASGAHWSVELDASEAIHQMADALTELLVVLGRERPAVLVLRDLDRADPDTLELVERLCENLERKREPDDLEALLGDKLTSNAATTEPEPLAGASSLRDDSFPSAPIHGSREARVLVVGLAGSSRFSDDEGTGGRDEDSLGAGAEARPSVARWSEHSFCHSVPFEPLDEDSLRLWLGQRHGGAHVYGSKLRRLLRRTGGAPRRIDALLDGPDAQAALADDLDDGTVSRPAASLSELLAARAESLSGAARALLEALSVHAAPVLLDDLAPVLELAGEDRTVVEHCNELARELAAAGCIELRRARDGFAVAWFSAAWRRRVAASVAEPRRVALCRAAASASQAAGGELAAHYAREAGNARLFRELAIVAARQYLAAHSFRTAAELLEAILATTEWQPAEPPTAEFDSDFHADASLREALRELASIHRRARRPAEAIERLTALLALEERGGSLERRAETHRLLGEAHQEAGDGVNAHYFLEKSLSLLEGKAREEQLVEALLSLAAFNQRRGHARQAEAYAQRALDALGRRFDAEAHARACLLLGRIYAKTNNHSRSLQFLLQAADGAREARDLPRVLEASQSLGLAFMACGDYDKALEQFSRGVELATLMQSKRALATIYNHLGTIHFNRANAQLALESYVASLRIWKEIGEARGVANSYNNIGLALGLRDDATNADEFFRRAIEIFTRLEDPHGQAAGMNNLAHILEQEGKYEEALDYAFRSLEKRKRFSSRVGMGFSYYRIARTYQARGELEKAYVYAEKALQIRRDVGEKMGTAYSKIQLAELMLVRGELENAARRCAEGEQEFKILQNRYGQLMAREILARAAFAQGDLGRATELLEETLAQARQGEQRSLVARALLALARVSIEFAEQREAELRLDRAEAIFREQGNRRQLAELLLEKCRLALDLGHNRRAAQFLETAYRILEQLGIRDLIASYFLLRGRHELAGDSPADSLKFLERALVEARETGMPDVHWKVLLYTGEAEERFGRAGRASEHYRRAAEILDGMRDQLPESSRAHFDQLRERQLLRRKLAGTQGGSNPREIGAARPLAAGAAAAADPGEDVAVELDALRRQNRQLLKLQTINRELNREPGLDVLLETILDAVLELTDAEHGFLVLSAPPGTEEQEPITIARDVAGQSVSDPDSKISRSICDEVLRTGQPLLTTSAMSDDRLADSKSVQDLRLLSVLCLPLKLGDEVIGAIYLDNRSRLRAFDQEDLPILETFCDQATTAIRNARLSSDLQNRNRELTALNEQMEELNRRLFEEVQTRTDELEMTRKKMEEQRKKSLAHRPFQEIVGKSEVMQRLFGRLERAAPTSLPVLIQGESGTGKELVARAIHDRSARKNGRFISENCAALSDSLLESELFGHVRGAFTGATSVRKGLFELADGGTLFLDEVAEMSLSMQKKLLRVLQEGELRQVGGKETLQVDVRILCASNRDLRRLVEEGQFREDLYYRLNGIRIDLPPLRERREDIPLLTHHFLNEIASESNTRPRHVSPEALRVLLQYDWPGNVRELKHFLERTALLLEGDVLRAEDCRFELESETGPTGETDGSAEALDTRVGLPRDWSSRPLREARDLFTQRYVERCYAANDFNATQAARACGMSRESFHRYLKKFGIGR